MFTTDDIRSLISTYAPVLVTNGTRPIPLQIIKQLLELGCRVRTTLSWMESASWLDKLFAPYVASGKFERVTLPPGHATSRYFYQDAVKGVSAIVHTPTLPQHFNQPLSDIWTIAADSVRFMLEAAEHEPTVRAFVYTSSIRAAAPLVPQADLRVKEDSWNAKDTILALTARGQCNDEVVLSSSLVRAEQAVWQWKSQQRPGTLAFKVNVVSPSNVIGQNFGARHHNHWRNWIWRLYKTGRSSEAIRGAGPTQAHWYVDVEDVALLHVAAIFDPEISGQRLQAWGSYRDWNDTIDILNEYDPESSERRPLIGHDGVTRGQLYTRAPEVHEILQRWKGTDSSQPYWKPFEKTICESVDVFRRMSRGRRAASEEERAEREVAAAQDKAGEALVYDAGLVPLISEDYFAKFASDGRFAAASGMMSTPSTPVSEDVVA